MNYPIEILPNPAYKLIECELSDHFLIRFFNCNKPEEAIDENTGKLKIEHICSPREQIEDLSHSLLGVYKPEHIEISFTDLGKQKFLHYCNPNEDVQTPIFEDEYFFAKSRSFWCAPIAKLNNRQFEYSKSEQPMTATCMVVHTPMRWNYWHFSLRWKTNFGELSQLDERARKNVAKRIGQAARVAITHFAILGIPETPILSEECYIDNN